MKTHEIQLRVRYSETDQMGVVYHGNYLPYFEIGRVEWLRHYGVSYKWMEENGVGLPIATLTLNYKKPARYDELLTVRTTFRSQSSVKIDFDCEILNEQGQLLTTLYIMLVFVNFATGKPMAPPDYIREIIERVEGGV